MGLGALPYLLRRVFLTVARADVDVEVNGAV